MALPADETIYTLTVPVCKKSLRLDAFVADQLREQGVSRVRVRELIQQGRVSVDKVRADKPAALLSGTEKIIVQVPVSASSLVPQPGEVTVLHEEVQFVLIDKPAGLVVHPVAGEAGKGETTLVHLLMHRYEELSQMGGERPGIVHRLDKDTSGLLLVARNEATRLALCALFARRCVSKYYLALVHGCPKGTTQGGLCGSMTSPVGRHPRIKTRMAVLQKGGRSATTQWKRLWTSPDKKVSLLRVAILTGRTHQIRVHMASAGHPVIGDTVYGAREHAAWLSSYPEGSGISSQCAQRQMLHAWKLGLRHPETNEEMNFCSQPPEDFISLLQRLAHKPFRVGITGMPGCGKSTVCALLEQAGIPVFSSDACVSKLYACQADGWHMLRQQFGSRYAPDGQAVDKKALFISMCKDANFRREVLRAIHPLVRHRLELFWQQQTGPACPVLLAEVPLLFETHWDHTELFDYTAGIACKDSVRHVRLQQTRGWDEKTITELESWQWSQDRKLAACDHIIHNSTTRDELEKVCDKLSGTLQSLAQHAAQQAEQTLKRLWQCPQQQSTDKRRQDVSPA